MRERGGESLLPLLPPPLPSTPPRPERESRLLLPSPSAARRGMLPQKPSRCADRYVEAVRALPALPAAPAPTCPPTLLLLPSLLLPAAVWLCISPAFISISSSRSEAQCRARTAPCPPLPPTPSPASALRLL